MHLPLVCEEEHIVMCGRYKEVFNKILLLCLHSDHAFTTPALAAICVDRHTLDVACVSDGYDHVLHRYEVFIFDPKLAVDDFSPARVAVFFFDLGKLGLNDFKNHLRVGKHLAIVFNLFLKLSIFNVDLLTLKCGEALKPHVKDCLRLNK
ncbi:hypothetical protein BMS3Abin16_01242 [archaeon BMS3Abin16]|nr:hypothetical protein BMS3Abin16_01242 [archaeon BMS3Abin16]